MSYNYSGNPQSNYYNQGLSPQQNNQFPSSNGQFQQQNIQPLFPQPQGNVYNINSTLEVANVPTGAGISVALCLQEGFMYIKTMQNGNPMFWAYKILPYDNAAKETEETPKDNSIATQLEQYDNRFVKIEQQVEEIQKSLRKGKGEWNV